MTQEVFVGRLCTIPSSTPPLLNPLPFTSPSHLPLSIPLSLKLSFPQNSNALVLCCSLFHTWPPDQLMSSSSSSCSRFRYFLPASQWRSLKFYSLLSLNMYAGARTTLPSKQNRILKAFPCSLMKDFGSFIEAANVSIPLLCFFACKLHAAKQGQKTANFTCVRWMVFPCLMVPLCS